jgi:hypothetical protein
MKYGYARLSTDGQSVDAQVRQLSKAGCKKVFRETASGAQTDRAQLRKALDLLDAGGVLVVGTGASGCQFAEELLQAGRPVFLSVGPHRRVPRRYRGWDIIWWIMELGLDEKVADEHLAGSRRYLLAARAVDTRSTCVPSPPPAWCCSAG